jgi:hypothetical protein
MTIFVFDGIQTRIRNNTIDLATGNFYAHLVTVQPAPTVTAVSGLTLASYTGYASQTLTGVTYTGGIWDFNNPLFPVNTGSSQGVVGMVVCERVGGSPASTDPPVVFTALRQAGVPVTITINTNERLQVNVGTNGILQTLGRHIFNSGTFSTDLDTNGTIYQLGTRNGAQAYVNPGTSGTRIRFYSAQTTGTLTSNSTISADIFNRSAGGGSYFPPSDANIISVIEFVNTLVNPSKLYINRASVSLPVTNAKIYGAKVLDNFTASYINNESNWELLASGVTIPNTTGSQVVTLSNFGKFYKFIGISTGTNSGFNKVSIREIELYESAIASVTSDLT